MTQKSHKIRSTLAVMTLVSVFALTQASAAPKKPPSSKKSVQTQMRAPAPLPIPAPEPTPVAPVAPIIAPPEAIAPPESDEAARAAFQGGLAASAAGQLPAAEAAFRQALSLAPAGENGDLVSMEAAKRLGFLAFEKRDPRMAETFFGAEAVLARRLYFSAKISARAFSDAVGRFASATGAMGRSGDSAALVFYAQEIKSRAQAETSAQLLNRDANNAADEVGSIRIADTELCVVGRDPLLKARVSCADEAGARGEALSMQARQIRASAPPPPTKAEREAKAAKNKGKEG